MKLQLSPMLDLSTAHLSVDDRMTLERLAMELRRDSSRAIDRAPIRVYDTEYGFIVYVNTAVDDMYEDCTKYRYNLSNSFWETFRYAADNNCLIVNYDVDSDIHDGLQTFEDQDG